MQINKISSSQNFGMYLEQPKYFWSAVHEKIWTKSKNAEQITQALGEILMAPTKNVYAIERVNLETNKVDKKNLSKAQRFLKIGYKLIDKTKNEIVLEKTAVQNVMENSTPRVTPADFIIYIAKNLKKIQQAEKQNSLF